MSSKDTVQTLSDNGAAAAVNVVGEAYITAAGTFGSGTLQFQRQGSDDAWRDIPAASLTADGVLELNFPFGSQNTIRANLSGATSPNISVSIQGASPRA